MKLDRLLAFLEDGVECEIFKADMCSGIDCQPDGAAGVGPAHGVPFFDAVDVERIVAAYHQHIDGDGVAELCLRGKAGDQGCGVSCSIFIFVCAPRPWRREEK